MRPVIVGVLRSNLASLVANIGGAMRLGTPHGRGWVIEPGQLSRPEG